MYSVTVLRAREGCDFIRLENSYDAGFYIDGGRNEVVVIEGDLNFGISYRIYHSQKFQFSTVLDLF